MISIRLGTYIGYSVRTLSGRTTLGTDHALLLSVRMKGDITGAAGGTSSLSSSVHRSIFTAPDRLFLTV